jgi:hypothetical protein
MNVLKRLFHILFILCLFFFYGYAQEGSSSSLSWNDSIFAVHGRLMIYNGTPSFRIWIIGTTHLLGIDQIDDSNPIMPDTLKNLIGFGKKIYADFVVKSLSKYKRGEMQYVQVLSARNIIVRH